jgi:predicted Zn-ribbon and HTH transcriptional regulator
MEGPDRTTRQRIADYLREESATAAAIAEEFGVTTSSALSHVDHVVASLDGTDEQLLAAPPECRDCGFDRFDDLINRPSRCPDCKSENVAEPVFTID